jgi:PhzF family phenazine biosynthesis protein
MLLDEWLPDAQLQAIADENHISETAFLVESDADAFDYELRWFTPLMEVDLCGHATLASVHVLFHHLGFERETIFFSTRSGRLPVTRAGADIVLDFPARRAQPIAIPSQLEAALGAEPVEVLGARSLLVVMKDEETVRALRPDMTALANLDAAGVIVTAPGREASIDFVSRYFAPKAGIPEDPVTGSAHCTSAPYWADRFGRRELNARQLSARGGSLRCTVDGDRVHLAGRAVIYLEGTATIGDEL